MSPLAWFLAVIAPFVLATIVSVQRAKRRLRDYTFPTLPPKTTPPKE